MADVMIIDDDPSICKLWGVVLEQEGHRIRTASEGGEALAQLAEAPADLVITDLLMPGREGIETIQILRRDHPDTPIIAVSGGMNGDPRTILRTANLLGAVRTFAKPVEARVLVEAVREMTETGVRPAG